MNSDLLTSLARKYVWWRTPDDATRVPSRVIAQVMNIGDYDDVQNLLKTVGEAPLHDALAAAEAGQFNARSWHYWHYRLGMAAPLQVPPLPVRKFA